MNVVFARCATLSSIEQFMNRNWVSTALATASTLAVASSTARSSIIRYSSSSSLSAPATAMGKGDKSNSTETPKSPEQKGQKKSKATHFLCFPIASEQTISELHKSIQHFKAVSTKPDTAKRTLKQGADGRFRVTTKENQEGQGRDATPDREDEQTAGATDDKSKPEQQVGATRNDPLGNISNPTTNPASDTSLLRVLPAITHRPAGTYHLTIGVMDLSDETQMKKAKDLLQSLDLTQMLRDAEKGPPAGSKAARKWVDKRPEDETEKTEGEDKGEDRTADGGSRQAVTQQSDEETTHGVKSLERSISPPTLAPAPAPTHPETPASLASTSASHPPTAQMTIAPPPPLHISLTGLSAFPNPKSARVIWARPHEQVSPSPSTPPSSSRPTFPPQETSNSRLYNLALHIAAPFRAANLITETRPLVLHATVANMRYATQAKGGRTSKGKAWSSGGQRWREGSVDVRGLIGVFNSGDGDVSRVNGGGGDTFVGEEAEGETDRTGGGGGAEERHGGGGGRLEVDDGDTDKADKDASRGFIWVQDVPIDRVAICKMGSTKVEDPVWGEWYPAVSERTIFDHA